MWSWCKSVHPLVSNLSFVLILKIGLWRGEQQDVWEFSFQYECRKHLRVHSNSTSNLWEGSFFGQEFSSREGISLLVWVLYSCYWSCATWLLSLQGRNFWGCFAANCVFWLRDENRFQRHCRRSDSSGASLFNQDSWYLEHCLGNLLQQSTLIIKGHHGYPEIYSSSYPVKWGFSTFVIDSKEDSIKGGRHFYLIAKLLVFFQRFFVLVYFCRNKSQQIVAFRWQSLQLLAQSICVAVSNTDFDMWLSQRQNQPRIFRIKFAR